MKRWSCVALACAGVVCLLLGLCHQHTVPSVNNHQRIACHARSVGPLVGPAPASPAAAASPRPWEPRAAPLESLAAHFVFMTRRDPSAPWRDTRGPPRGVPAALINCWAAAEAGSPKQQDRAQPLRKMRVASES